MPKAFDRKEIKKLYQPRSDSSGEDNGQVTIIGGSELFHGAPLLSLKVASRICDMVFFASPNASIGKVVEQIKSKLLSFIWVPWDEAKNYIKKSGAALIGPGFMRYKSEKVPNARRNHRHDEAARESRKITRDLLGSFPNKHWVIDAGSLQVMDADWIPKNAILTPNKKEFELLFGKMKPDAVAKKHNCIIILKGQVDLVCSPKECLEVRGGNPGLTKGGTGDVLAGLTVALLAKNEPFLATSCASYITKAAADELYKKVGTNYSADDLADKIPETLHDLAK